jgi:hypothetical protein
MKARDPSRPVMINFGPGVADPPWIGRGTCTGDEAYYDQAIAGADILSFDIYPAGTDVPRVKGKLEYVAAGVANLVRRASSGQQVWTAIETSALDPMRPVRAEEVRSEVWMALIHGARGITYFTHEFAPAFREDAIFRHPDVVAEVTQINRLVKSLAPVLNAEPSTRTVVASSASRIDTMIRVHGGSLYLFAVEMEGRRADARLAMQNVNSTEAEVLGENRQATILNGAVVDVFPKYGVHIYRIPLPIGK